MKLMCARNIRFLSTKNIALSMFNSQKAITCFLVFDETYFFTILCKQAGTGPSWRHISYLRLKNSKRLQILVSWGSFYKKIFLKKSHDAEKTEREDSLGVLNIHFVLFGHHINIVGGKITICAQFSFISRRFL